MTEHVVDPNARGIDSDDLASLAPVLPRKSRRRCGAARGHERASASGPDARTRCGDGGSVGAHHRDLVARVSRDSARSPCSGAGRGGPVSLKQAGPTCAHMPDTDTSARPVFRLMVRRLVSRTMGIVSAARRRPCDGRPAFGGPEVADDRSSTGARGLPSVLSVPAQTMPFTR